MSANRCVVYENNENCNPQVRGYIHWTFHIRYNSRPTLSIVCFCSQAYFIKYYINVVDDCNCKTKK